MFLPPTRSNTLYSENIPSAAAYLPAFSQLWFPTVQDVLHADWQDVWHSPQPPFFALSQRLRVLRVLILFIVDFSVLSEFRRPPRLDGDA